MLPEGQAMPQEAVWWWGALCGALRCIGPSRQGVGLAALWQGLPVGLPFGWVPFVLSAAGPR